MPGMSDYTVFVKEQREGLPRRAAAREDGDRRGRPTTRSSAAPRCTRASSGLARLPRRRRARRAPARPRDRPPPQLAQARAGADRAARREPLHDPDELLGLVSADLEGAVRHARGDRPGRSTAPVRRVQAALRRRRWSRGWALDPRLPGRDPRATAGSSSPRRRRRRAQFIQLCNQSDVPLLFLQNITGFMVGKRVRAGRHHQARREDDQRGRRTPTVPHICADDRRLLRRRQLRHERPRATTRGSSSPGRTPRSR